MNLILEQKSNKTTIEKQYLINKLTLRKLVII